MGYPSVDLQSIEKWLVLAKKGDETALGMLIELTQGHLFRFSLYLCHDRQRAEDLCQDAYLKTLNRLDSIEEASKLLPWMFQVIKNQFIDYTRSAKSKETSFEDEGDSSEIVESSTSSPDTTLAVRACLAKLTEDHRLVIVLVDSEGYSYSEAAQLIGITEEALKSRLFRARKEFLEIYQKS